MHYRRSASESFPQLPREQNEFVDVCEPFADETMRAKKFSEDRRWRSYFCGNARGSESLQHHGRESLHALLAIERVITDQQNHWYDRYRQPGGEYDRQKQNAGAMVLPQGVPQFPLRHSPFRNLRPRDKARLEL